MTVDRRRLFESAGWGAAAVLGELEFLRTLRPVAAQEAQIAPGMVRLRPEIEPLVRLLEETPRAKVLEAVAGRIRAGVGYRELLAALQLAGVRNIKPRPVGFKFHAVLVVNSAHLATLDSPESDRWLPYFWAVDSFKSSQAQDVSEGDWHMAAPRESALPAAGQARSRFIEAMDRWDEDAADLAVTRLARVAGAAEVFELFWRFGARDFRDIGHKAIYAANSWRTLQVIGWEHAEPILRSLAFALLQRGRVNPAEADEAEDRPWRRNLELVKGMRPDWQAGSDAADGGATAALLAAFREATPEGASREVAAALKSGAGAAVAWDAVFAGAGELLMRQPGILGIHCVTSANALYHAYQTSGSDETRLLMLLQAAAFMPFFRQAMARGRALPDAPVDRLERAGGPAAGPEALEAIFADASGDRPSAARRTLAYLDSGGDARELLTAARRLIFLKGTNSHDYKFSSAALEDFYHVSPAWRNRYLATAMFNLRGSRDRDNPLSQRTRAALAA